MPLWLFMQDPPAPAPEPLPRSRSPGVLLRLQAVEQAQRSLQHPVRGCLWEGSG